ncbi:hypothetical protein GCM10011402_16060 [Paracoccus acridae]|uniref:Host attachment protein n=1 Tax=Paracoccus acridae TaxID=1795310 RepID=A0ABQ1VGR2_9RHOB|nr:MULTISPECIES: host attachment protein [Paracoccus]GGF64661.1 hypothetical protein GCM10011402_16060 [Paracoccus acridae]
MLPHDTLVVVTDGQSATLFRNAAKHGIELSETERITLDSMSQHKAGDASPGIVAAGDPAVFAARLADHLNDMVLKHKADDVVIIADPPTLGVLRKRYHKELQFRLRREVARNLTNSDLRAIEDALSL